MALSYLRQRAPLFDIHPWTGASIEVFYADRSLVTFGGSGSGWFWWSRRRGFAPGRQDTGPFATSYAAYRDALISGCFNRVAGLSTTGDAQHYRMCRADEERRFDWIATGTARAPARAGQRPLKS